MAYLGFDTNHTMLHAGARRIVCVRKRLKLNRLAWIRVWHKRKREANEELYKNETRAARLRRKYGMTHEDYERLLKEQNGHCALCDKRPEQERYPHLHVDHCHETGRIRGLLCNKHNLIIGQLGDTEEAISKVLDYLKSGT